MAGLLIRLIGLLWIIGGIIGLVATKRAILALSNLLKNSRRQTLGLLSLIFGVLLMISSAAARESWFIFALGIIACFKGIMTVFMPEQKLKTVIDWWLAAPEIVYKCGGIFLLVLGIVVFYVV